MQTWCLLLVMLVCFCSAQTFWHITDIHLDPLYVPSSHASTYCHTFINGSLVKPFGDYFCDTPETLVQSALSFISSNYSNFVIYSGDSAPHVNVSSWEEAFNKTKIVTNLLKQYLPTTRVLPCLGNADFYPTNYAPFQEPFDVYRQVGELWSSWLEPSSLETFSTGGYYSQLIEPGLRILVLNTNLYYNVKRQYPYTMNMSDPANQFMWMESVLNSSRANNEKVLIVGHVPPGMFERAAGFVVKEGWFYDKFNERYVSIIRSHCNTIVGQLFGHEHSDSFKIVFSKDNQTACNAIMINPSIGMWNPNQNVNSSKPAIRAYSYDPITKMLKNYTQYSANIDNATFSGNLTWTIEYRSDVDNNMTNLTAAGWNFYLMNLNRSNYLEDDFKQFLIRGSVGFETILTDNCQTDSLSYCKLRHICAITRVSYSEFDACITIPTPYSVTWWLILLIFSIPLAILFVVFVCSAITAFLLFRRPTEPSISPETPTSPAPLLSTPYKRYNE